MRWPTELVDWSVDGSLRLDLVKGTEETMSRRALPFDEKTMMRWNGNPFKITNEGGSGSEYDPGYFTLPFWLFSQVVSSDSRQDGALSRAYLMEWVLCTSTALKIIF